MVAALLAAPSSPAAPPNDSIANAITIESLPFMDRQETRTATRSPGDPRICGWPYGRTIWYRFTPAESMTVHLLATSRIDEEDAGVFQGSPSALVQVPGSCNDSGTFSAQAGTTYYIVVAAYPGDPRTTLRLRRLEQATNDDFDAARPIAATPFLVALDPTDATSADDDPGDACLPDAKTVWFSYTNSTSARQPLVLRSKEFSEWFSDNPISIYTGSRGALAKVACGTRLELAAEPGETYHVMLGGEYYWEHHWLVSVEKTLFAGDLTLARSPGRVPYGGRVRIVARLHAFKEISDELSVYAQPPAGGPRTLLGSGHVDSQGELVVFHKPTRATQYEATWNGGEGYTTAVSPAQNVQVLARVTTTMQRPPRRAGSKAVYPAGASPRIATRVAPNKRGKPIRLQLQVRVGSRWYALSLRPTQFPLGTGSAVVVRFIRPTPHYDYRIRSTFRGDKENLASTAPWAYFRVG